MLSQKSQNILAGFIIVGIAILGFTKNREQQNQKHLDLAKKMATEMTSFMPEELGISMIIAYSIKNLWGKSTLNEKLSLQYFSQIKVTADQNLKGSNIILKQLDALSIQYNPEYEEHTLIIDAIDAILENNLRLKDPSIYTIYNTVVSETNGQITIIDQSKISRSFGETFISEGPPILE